MKNVMYIICFLMLFACDPQRRISRIVERHPDLVLNDTINYSMLVIHPSRSSLLNMPDSIFSRLLPGDSIISVTKKGITIIVRKKPESTEIGAYVTSDTVKVDTTLVVPKVKVISEDKARILTSRVVYIVSILFLILVIYLILKRVINGR